MAILYHSRQFSIPFDMPPEDVPAPAAPRDAHTRHWSALAHRLHPYVPGAQRSGADIIKLNTNENPWPVPERVLDAIAAVGADALRRYPDPESRALRERVAERHALAPEQVYAGNGSDELLGLAFLAFLSDAGARVQAPAISYSFYPVWAELAGIQLETLPLAEDWSVDLDAFDSQADAIVLANPNAPTGHAHSRDAIVALLERCPNTLVLVDEAYVDFGGESVLELIDRFHHLLVMQTWSKSRSLAGLRLGLAFADAGLIAGLVRVKNAFNSYPVDALAQAAALAVLEDDAWVRDNCQRVIATREHTRAELLQRGWSVLPSAANFVLASPADGNAEAVLAALDRRGILVRHFATVELSRWLRISIGTDQQMQALFNALDAM